MLEKIQESDLFLLKAEDKALLKGVEKFFQYLPMGHSHYQIKNFIIGQFERCSPDRAHRQCLLEIHTRYQSLLDMHYRYRKTELEMEEQNISIREAQYRLDNVTQDQFERERLELSIKKAHLEKGVREWTLANIRKGISEAVREAYCFKEEMERLSSLCRHPLAERYERSEPEYWQKEYLHKFIQGKRGENLPPIPEADRIRLLDKVKEEVKRLEE